MANWTECKLTQTEYFDRLEFQLERSSQGMELLGLVLTVVVGGCIFYFADSIYWKGFAAFGVLSAVVSTFVRLAQGRTALLIVRADGIEGRGNLGNFFVPHLKVAIEDIAPVYFHPGDEDGEPAILVRHGWTNDSLLVGVTRAQARQIFEAIRARFPEIQVDTDLHEFSWQDYGLTGSEPITLGLSHQDKSEDSPQS